MKKLDVVAAVAAVGGGGGDVSWCYAPSIKCNINYTHKLRKSDVKTSFLTLIFYITQIQV